MAPHEIENSKSASESAKPTQLLQRKLTNSILKVRGTEIVNGDGEPVILKGLTLKPLRGNKIAIADLDPGWARWTHEYGEFHHRFSRSWTWTSCCHVGSTWSGEIWVLLWQGKTSHRPEWVPANPTAKFLDYFFTASDAKFFAEQGLNCIRIPFNYRHFEDDLNPGVYIPEGFLILDRIIERCAAENFYVVLDLHAVPGGQNQAWHSDFGIHKALFWQLMEFHNRMINLWKVIASHCKDNVHVIPVIPNTAIKFAESTTRLPVTIHLMNQQILHTPTCKPFTPA